MTTQDRRRRYLDRLPVRTGDRTINIAMDDVGWMETSGDGVRLHAGDRTFLYAATLPMLVPELDPSAFVQISDSVVINLDSVVDFKIQPTGDCRILLNDGTAVEADRTLGDKLQTAMGSL